MDYFTIVRPEHLNHYGYLFGGEMLKWVDEYAYITAIREFPNNRFVTRGMDAASFNKSVRNGAMLRFTVQRAKLGNTTVTYNIKVFAQYLENTHVDEVFDINVTMNAVDHNGQKVILPR